MLYGALMLATSKTDKKESESRRGKGLLPSGLPVDGSQVSSPYALFQAEERLKLPLPKPDEVAPYEPPGKIGPIGELMGPDYLPSGLPVDGSKIAQPPACSSWF